MHRSFLACCTILCCLSAHAAWTHVETFSSSELKHMIVCPSSTPNTPQVFTGQKGIKWQYWLGGGNHACYGAQDSCMYLRARKKNETCDYGYLTNATPLSGGLRSLSFTWKQGGDEAEITNYDIAILVNDSLVGEIKQAAQAVYTTPADSTPFYYEIKDLNIPGDFTIRIENRTIYTGSVSVNRGRFIFNDLTLTMLQDDPGEPMVHGYVFDQNKQAVAGAVMSDGYEVVQTDQNGYYEIELNAFSEFVFISVPSGFDIPVDADGAPHMYQTVNQFGDQRIDFTLHRQADGGRADSTHVMLAISDPQVLDNYNLWRYRQESIKDMQALMATYPAGTKFYASVVGDIVWDWYNAFDAQRTTMASLGIPCFMTIGNHDHNCKAAYAGDNQDRVADDLYTAVFGPNYYSYNIGAIHYISIDNIYYTGYSGNKTYEYKIPDYQLDWIEQDVAMLPEGTPIVVFCHAIANGAGYIGTLQSLLNKGDVMQYIISGHSHNPHLYAISDHLKEHNLGAVMGAYWCSDWCSDGTPNGYEVLQAGPKGYTDYYYKSTGYDRDYQFRAYAPGNIKSDHMSDRVRANVWFYEKDWKVYVYENGVKNEMKLYSGKDPIAYDVMLEESDTRPNYPGTDGGTIASKNPGVIYAASHMFQYQPKKTDATFEIEVVDGFGNTYRQPVIHNMMVADFADQDTAWVYSQDFNSLFSYPNHFTTTLAKGTFVQGHYPLGWYATTNGSGSTFNTFNYYRIGNGSHNTAGLYNFGEGDPTVATKNKTERCIGLLPGSTNKAIAAGLILENNTQEPITALDISYAGEIWRVGSSKEAQTLQFEYLINPDVAALRNRTKWLGELAMTACPALNFSTPATLQTVGTNVAVDGNNVNNRSIVHGTLPLTLQPKECVLLRWTNTYNNGKEQGIGIDDVRIRAVTSSSGLSTPDALPQSVKKILLEGQIRILKNHKVYNLLGESCTNQ